MKAIALLVCAIMISGCDFAVYGHEIKGYESACSERGGVAKIDNISRRGVCADGNIVSWSN